MWSYYGSKTTIAKYYPKPKFNKIIEPFAGAAKYSLLHFENDVLLVDKYDVIINIWKWLQKCSKEDILKLPRMKQGDHVDSFTWDCQEAKDLMGYLIGFSTTTPRKTGTIKLTERPNRLNYSLSNIADSLYKIRHWEIQLGSYSEIKNQEATWFIDPPYVKAGEEYKYNSKDINYEHLGTWAKNRKGHAIVCESIGADWMEFKPMIKHRVSKGILTDVIWSNYPTEFDKKQLKLNF